jgi:hypothetical protein
MIAPQPLGGVESTRRWIGKDINAALQWDKKKIHALLISTPVRKIFEKHNKEHLTKEEAQSAAFHGPNRKVIVSAPTPHVPYDLKSFLEKKVPSWLAISITS